ncbi:MULTISPECIES: hypothetical protein [unclassified Oceanobacillus]|uniref:hypothetical protein n=1 Tax=unclassified Oceanobacillus TaxID=2630292 RepID=UPI001BE65E86|nr:MULTISPECIES: hypothetical protein [unclassified Oceanobacillus]MBT2600910.1 hypothetical protein [Oceanobacillus sp. ISL-74]MBT2653429.1 hypothetical protein [Oceanobacillus sp. ISL-73]
MNLKKIAEAMEIISEFDDDFIHFSIDYTGPKMMLSDSQFESISTGQDVFYEDRQNGEYPQAKCFYAGEIKVYRLVDKGELPSNPYGLTEQEFGMREANIKESDFVE